MFNDSYKKGGNSEIIFSDNRTLRLIEARKSSEDLDINIIRLNDLTV